MASEINAADLLRRAEACGVRVTRLEYADGEFYCASTGEPYPEADVVDAITIAVLEAMRKKLRHAIFDAPGHDKSYMTISDGWRIVAVKDKPLPLAAIEALEAITKEPDHG